jgi:hypothetical protein
MGKKTKTESLKIGADSPVGLKLAYWFWIELGRPAQFHTVKTLSSWSTHMESLLARSELDYERFKWFLVWVTRPRDADGANYGNYYTATYLRKAHDPAACLAKHFDDVFFNFFMPKSESSLPLLIEKREQEDDEKDANQERESEDRVRFVDILVKDASAEQIRDAQDLDRLDDAFPMLYPRPEESMEDWIDREFETFEGDNWKCKNCTYSFSIDDGDDDPRIKVCAECNEERILWAEDDAEWIHDLEVEEVFRIIYPLIPPKDGQF